MKYILPVLLLIAASLSIACDPKTVDQRVNDIKDKRVLPSGLGLWVEDGAHVSQVEINAIERGMRECIVRATAKGYTQAMSLTSYTVVVFGNSVKRNGVWGYQIPVKGTGYEGSIYDHDGFIHIAGQYLNNRTDKHYLVLPDYQDDDLNTLANVAGYEVEHPVLRYNDPAEYIRTLVHTPQTAHPLF